MNAVNITELRRHLPEYIARAEAGEEIMVSRRGAVVARLVAAGDHRTRAREQLAQLRTQAVVGDVVSPVGADWEAAD